MGARTPTFLDGAAIHCTLSSGLEVRDLAPIDDGDPAFAGWSAAELHEFFARHQDSALFAGQFLEASVRAALVETGGPARCRGLAAFAPDRPTESGLPPRWRDDAEADGEVLRRRAVALAAAFHEHPAIAPVRWSSEQPSPAPAAPLAIALTGKRRFGWLEPVVLDLRLWNRDAMRPLPLRMRPEPAYGALGIEITGPDGVSRRFRPVVRLVSAAPGPVLAAGGGTGRDHIVVELFLGYGVDGHYFAKPGRYMVSAALADPAGELSGAASFELEVLAPATTLEERLGADVYGHQAGLVLALGGSRSTYLVDGMWALEDLIERLPDSPAAGRIAAMLAEGLVRPMFRVERGRLRLLSRADRPRALALARRAAPILRREAATGPAWLRLMGRTCRWLTEEGQHDAARALFAELVEALGGDAALFFPPDVADRPRH